MERSCFNCLKKLKIELKSDGSLCVGGIQGRHEFSLNISESCKYVINLSGVKKNGKFYRWSNQPYYPQLRYSIVECKEDDLYIDHKFWGDLTVYNEIIKKNEERNKIIAMFFILNKREMDDENCKPNYFSHEFMPRDVLLIIISYIDEYMTFEISKMYGRYTHNQKKHIEDYFVKIEKKQ